MNKNSRVWIWVTCECTHAQAYSELLRGAKVSPTFIIWQDGKPQVVTDHTTSGLNDGIPREEAKVHYDDLHDFGQSLHYAHEQNPRHHLVLFKDDIAKAFLNLPAHLIWQLCQFVAIDGVLY